MDTSEPSAPDRRKQGAFSLIETILAIGIVSFAFVAIFGLLPAGLRVFRQAIDTSVGSQIAQRVVGDAQQTDFDQLVTDSSGAAITAGTTGRKGVRYFDDQGNEVPAATNAIYHVNTRIQPATPLPMGGAAATNASLATVTIQVANNPANQSLDLSNNLWTGNTNNAIAILTYATMVSKNK